MDHRRFFPQLDLDLTGEITVADPRLRLDVQRPDVRPDIDIEAHLIGGRIGRGAAASTCLLLFGLELGEAARARLNIIKVTEDGFRIAEEDLRLRGAGELMGARQSGMPAFRMADMAVHGELLAAARDDAALIIACDPELTGPRGAALRTLLYLFERDAAVRLLRSG